MIRRRTAREGRGRINWQGLGGPSSGVPAAPPSGAVNFASFASGLGLTVLACWQSDLGVTLSTGVSAWADQSGNGNTLAQASGSLQPAYTSSDAGINGFPSITGDGVDDILASSTFDLPATPISQYTVFKQVTWALNRSLWSAGPGNNYLCFTGSGGSTPQLFSSNLSVGSANTAGTVGSWFRGVQTYGNSTSDLIRIGSSTITGTNLGSSDPGAGYRIFANNGAVQKANIAMALHLVVANVLSGGNITSLDGQVTAMYGAGVAV